MTTTGTYRLVRRVGAGAPAPVLDADQQAVADHAGGPLLVLAGPGTGKTTTLVEAVVARIAGGLDPESVLVLTFGRAAAAELRQRVTARLGRATKEPLARTFHSYAFGVLRREAALRGDTAPRLLAGPEQDLVIRDLLDGDLAENPGAWPARLHPALRTRGFVQELRDLMMRAYERGVPPRELARLGRREGRDDWVAAARFMEQYAQVTALGQGAAYDPAELIRAVVTMWLAEPALLTRERAARTAVFVDELQDTDPAQLELLRLLAGDGRDLVAVGDADQSVYGFRGADVAGLDRFPDLFRTATGEPAPTVALRTCRRSGAGLLTAAARVATQLPGRGGHRQRNAADGLAEGRVEVAVLRSESQEAAHVAGRLRTAHLVEGVPWSQMAVVVRSTTHSLPVLRRALAAAGVPVAVAADEVPLAGQAAVRPFLTLLRCAVAPGRLDEQAAVELLCSPLGGADVVALRRLRQELRRLELAAGGGRASGSLLVEALTDARVLLLAPDATARPAARVARLLAAARDAHGAGGSSAEDVLWAVWSASGLAERWERASLDGGPAGLAADRDLDAVVALFEAAARFCDRLPGARADLFLDHLEGQQIPGDSLAPRAPAGEAVTVLTAHASKGLEWRLVCVAGVQEGLWPTARLRGSFLGSERLVDLLRPGTSGLPAGAAGIATLSRLLDEERRLFYVAVTRAREQLLVTAVGSEREGLVPSRFLDELDPLPAGEPRRATVPVRRPFTLAGLVGELRRAVQGDLDGSTDGSDDDGTSAAVRRGAAAQLARLAAAGARGADPAEWWGLAPLSDDRALHEPGESVRVSPSTVDAFAQCQLRWFLERVGGSGAPSTAQTVGSLVHAVAETAVDAASAGEEALLATFEGLLGRADLGSGWHAGKEVERARAMIGRLARWLAANERSVVAAELDFAVKVGRAEVAGRVDRLERDAEGRGVVVDFKTGSTKADDVAAHPQLAAYQVAADAGAFADVGVTASGGAALVQLGKGATRDAREQAQQPLSAYDDPGWARRLVVDVAEGMAGSAFRAVENKRCAVCPVATSCPVQDAGRVVTS